MKIVQNQIHMRNRRLVSDTSYVLHFRMLIIIVVTMASLKRELDEAELRELRQGRSPHPVTVSTFIENALQIEEEQYVSCDTTLI
jgi:hypothetical protein